MNNLLSEKDARAVLDFLVEQLGVQEAQLTADARIGEDLGADSLTKVEIIMGLEERFNLSIPDEMAEQISTVGELFEALAELLGSSSRS